MNVRACAPSDRNDRRDAASSHRAVTLAANVAGRTHTCVKATGYVSGHTSFPKSPETRQGLEKNVHAGTCGTNRDQCE